MIRVHYFSPDSPTGIQLPESQLVEAVERQDGVLWVEIFNEPPERCREIFKDVFGFHPLVIEDALLDSHSPKINEWDGYLYIVLHAPSVGETDGLTITTEEIDLLLGQNYIITYHHNPIPAISDLREVISHDPRILQKGPGYLLYRLGDLLVNVYLQVFDQIDQDIDRFEDSIFKSPQEVVLESIFSHKRDLLHLRRMLSYQREVFNKLARDEYAEIESSNRLYFRDIYDNLVRIHDLAESLRELISGTLDIYLSVVNNQMNQIMKTLTVFTALFMPLAFLTGFFGMNFFSPVVDLQAWTGRLSFALILLILVLLPVLMYIWMRRRKWF